MGRGRLKSSRISALEWGFIACVLAACCSCQSLVKGSAAAAGGGAGAILSPAGAMAGAASAYGLAELYFQGEEIDDLEAREAAQREQFQSLVLQVVEQASPQVRDEIAGTLADDVSRQAKAAEENAKGFMEKAVDELVGLGKLVIFGVVAWLAATQLLPLAWKWWTRKKREAAEAEKTENVVKSVLEKSIPPDLGSF